MSLAWPSFCSTPLTISQQSFAPAVSHIFGALPVLKMRHALIVLPSKSDCHGPGVGAAVWMKTALSRNAMVQVMPRGISRATFDLTVACHEGTCPSTRPAHGEAE